MFFSSVNIPNDWFSILKIFSTLHLQKTHLIWYKSTHLNELNLFRSECMSQRWDYSHFLSFLNASKCRWRCGPQWSHNDKSVFVLMFVFVCLKSQGQGHMSSQKVFDVG